MKISAVSIGANGTPATASPIPATKSGATAVTTTPRATLRIA